MSFLSASRITSALLRGSALVSTSTDSVLISGSGGVGGILNLEGSVPQVSYPLRYKQQVFNDTNGDVYQIIGEDDASNQRVLFELHTATNNTTTHTVNFNTANLTGVNKINTYVANVLEVNNSNSQYLIKDVNLTADSILSVGSNNKISSTTPTIILGNLTAGNNLTKTGNQIKLNDSIDTAGSITCKTFLKIKSLRSHIG